MSETPQISHETQERLTAAERFLEYVESMASKEDKSFYNLQPSGLAFARGVTFSSKIDESFPGVKYASAIFWTEDEPFYMVTAFDGRKDPDAVTPEVYVAAGVIKGDDEGAEYGNELSDAQVSSLLSELDSQIH